MDRKKTILITALVNAALLVLLFAFAIHYEDAPPPQLQLSQAMRLEAPQEILLSQEENSEASSLEKIVYPLPPVVSAELVPSPLVEEKPVISQNAPSQSCLEVVVKKGDTLEKIAKANHTTVGELIKINQLSGQFLRIGQILKIPSSITTSNRPKSSPKESEPSKGKPEYYVVKVGDNPWTIAMKHHMKVDELIKLNQISEEKARKLKPGDRLRIR